MYSIYVWDCKAYRCKGENKVERKSEMGKKCALVCTSLKKWKKEGDIKEDDKVSKLVFLEGSRKDVT